MVVRQEFDRDSAIVDELRVLYDCRCQICGNRIQLERDRYYCEGHHLRPLGRDHGGADEKPNIIILCPTHHTEFDFFLFAVLDFRGPKRKLEHMTRKLSTKEATLTVRHELSSDSIDYVIEQFLFRLDRYFSRHLDEPQPNVRH